MGKFISAGRDPRIIIKYKLANETINNSNVLQDDDDMQFPIEANAQWYLFIYFNVQSSAVADFKYAISLPAGGAATAQSTWVRDTPNVKYDVTAATACACDGSAQGLCIKVLVLNGATAGTCKVQWAQNVAEVSNTIVGAGSNMIAYKVSN